MPASSTPEPNPVLPTLELFKHLLVPTDGSALSRAAAAHAVVIAAALKAQVTFFHARPEHRQSFFGGEGGAFVDQIETRPLGVVNPATGIRVGGDQLQAFRFTGGGSF